MSGYPSPQFTMTPNALFDIDMRDMSESELKVTLAVIRQTMGYHKNQPEPLSYTDLMKITGLSRQGVRDGIRRAIARRRVAVAPGGKRGVNRFVVHFDDQSTNQTSLQNEPEPVYKVDQSEGTINKEKEKNWTPSGVEASASPTDGPICEGMVGPVVDTPTPPTEREMVRDEILVVCGFSTTGATANGSYGRAGKIARYLMGQKQMDGKITYELPNTAWRAVPGDFTRFGQWWRKRYKDADVPRSLGKLAERWAEWREYEEALQARIMSQSDAPAARRAELALYGLQETA